METTSGSNVWTVARRKNVANVGAFFKKTLPSMALTVASEVPGPVGMVAGMVSNIVGKKISADPASIDTAIQGATPDQLLQLKEKDMDVKAAMQKAGFDDLEELAQISEQDVASARAREIAVKGWTTPALAWTIILATFGLIVASALGLNKTESTFVGGLIGYAVNMCQQVVGYYFGSSAGSAAKTQIMATQATQTQSTTGGK
jgi:hypothetical protein